MYGIIRIIAHNSYIAGLTTQIQAMGHTNNSGDNGAGKTSALRLIPFFYGKEPESLVNTSGGKKSFLDYYLPTPNSLVLFEYEREDGLNCVAMYRHPSQKKVVYRFIKSGYDSAFCTDGIHEKMMSNVSMADILKDIKDSGIYVSKSIGTIVGYRSVIQQNEVALRRSSKDRNNLRKEAKEFCLGTSESKSVDIDELAASLLNRDKMLPRLKHMIANTQLGDYGSVQKPTHLQNNALLDDISSMRMFTDYESDINECIDNAAQYRNSKTSINVMARTLKLAINEADAQLTKDNQLIDAYETQLTDIADQFSHKDSSFASELADKSSTLTVTTDRIEAIHGKKDEWDELEMDQKQSEYANLDSYQESNRQAQYQYASLTDQIKNIELEKESELNKIDKEHASAVQTIEAKKSAFQQEAAKKTSQASEKASLLTEERSKAVSDLKDSLHDEDIRLSVLEGEYTAKILNMGMTDDEEIQISAAEDRISETESQADVIADKKEKAQEEHNKVEEYRNAALSVLEELNSEFGRKDDALQALLRQRFPEDNTFLANLKASGSDWTKNVGRVIRPELLQSKNLSPELVEDAASTLFGWSIDLEQIELPDQALDEAALDDKISNLETEMSGIKKRIAEEEKRIRGLNSDLGKHNDILINLASALKSANADVQTAKIFLKGLKDSIKETISVRKADLQDELKEVKKQIANFKSSRDARIEEIQSIYSQKIMESKGFYDTEISRIEHNIEYQTELKNKQDNQRNESIKLTEAKFTEIAIKEGVDPELIKGAKKRAEDAAQKAKDVEGYLRLINEYQEWLKTSWGKVEGLTGKESDLKIEISKLEDARNSNKREHEKNKREITNNRNELSRLCRKQKADIKEAKLALGNTTYNQIGDTMEDRDFKLLCEKLSSENAIAKSLSDQVSKKLKKIYKVFVKFEEAQIAKAWANLDYARQNNSTHEEGSTEYEMEQAEDLKILVSDSIPQIKGSLLENVRSFGQSINNYYLNLKQISSRISRISTELGNAINSNQRIGSISDVNILLESQIEKFDCWGDLNKFSREWEEWRSSSDSKDLPPDSLVNTLRVANQSLNDAKIKDDKASLINLKISMYENGQRREINSDADFNNSSSNGLSYLAICIVFMGMTRYLCPDERVQLAWPIDELAALSPNNISSLFSMMNKKNIVMFSAFPSEDPSLLKHFESKNLISLKGVRKIEMQKAKLSIAEIKKRNQATKQQGSHNPEEELA